jgi:hypothetical protein
VEKSDPGKKDIELKNNIDNLAGKWINGPTVELFNTTLEDVTVNISMKNTEAWINGPSIVNLKPQEKVEVTLQLDINKIRELEPKPRSFLFFGGGSAKEYTGTLVFKTKNGEVSFSANMNKTRK